MEWLVVRPRNREVGVLFDEAFSLVLESIDCGIRPPVGVVAILVVVTTRAIKCVTQLVTRDGTKRAIGHVLRDIDVEDGELHDTCREDNFITWGVVVRIHWVQSAGVSEASQTQLLTCRDRHAPLVAINRLP